MLSGEKVLLCVSILSCILKVVDFIFRFIIPLFSQMCPFHKFIRGSIEQMLTFQEFKDVCKNLNKEQVEAAFKRFDQTGNEKLNFKEFSDMMTKRSDSRRNIVKTKTETGDKVDGAGAAGEAPSEPEEDKETESPRNSEQN